MRKLISLLLALVMLLGLIPAAMAAGPYTLDIYWVGAGDQPEIRKGVEKAINEYIEPKIGANVSFHIIPWDSWETDAVNALKNDFTKMDLIFTADWEFYGDLAKLQFKSFIDTGYAAEDEDNIRLTLKGFNVSNQISMRWFGCVFI